jgi:hypothetical protein
MSMKNSIYTIGNRAHDLPACSAVPQPTAPQRTPPPSRAEVIKVLGYIFAHGVGRGLYIFIVRVGVIWGCFGISSVVGLVVLVTLKPESCGQKPKNLGVDMAESYGRLIGISSLFSCFYQFDSPPGAQQINPNFFLALFSFLIGRVLWKII